MGNYFRVLTEDGTNIRTDTKAAIVDFLTSNKALVPGVSVREEETWSMVSAQEFLDAEKEDGDREQIRAIVQEELSNLLDYICEHSMAPEYFENGKTKDVLDRMIRRLVAET